MKLEPAITTHPRVDRSYTNVSRPYDGDLSMRVMLALQEPETSASTNSATSALGFQRLDPVRPVPLEPRETVPHWVGRCA